MADLKIRVFKEPAQHLATTITIPGAILRTASNLIPEKASAALKDEGIDLAEIVRLSENPDARGMLVEVEDHDRNEKIVVSLE